MKKYLIYGNGESPHLLKWTRELVKYFELYLVSSQDVSAEIAALIPANRILKFGFKISEGGGNLAHLRAIIPLARAIRRIRPHIINAHYITSHGFTAALAVALSRHPCQLVQSAWGTDILLTPHKNKFYKRITRFALNRAQLATSDSVTVSRVIQSLSKTETLRFPFGPAELPDARFSDKEAWLFFSNRTLNENSNIDSILHFFKRVADVREGARLIIANEGSKKENLISLRDELGLKERVCFTGFLNTTEQEAVYRRAQYYFSLPSSDALSVSLLEAMAYGCIPLVSDLPDNREWVEDGVNGLVLQKNDPAAILDPMMKNASSIYKMNREKIAEGAMFPRSIQEYVNSLMNIDR
jgi:L-malate glycosyltransferase